MHLDKKNTFSCIYTFLCLSFFLFPGKSRYIFLKFWTLKTVLSAYLGTGNLRYQGKHLCLCVSADSYLHKSSEEVYFVKCWSQRSIQNMFVDVSSWFAFVCVY